jgi:hypothetical protein
VLLPQARAGTTVEVVATVKPPATDKARSARIKNLLI